MAMRLPPVDSTAVRLEGDPGRKVGVWSSHPQEARIAIALPIRVTGIPDGMEVYSERVNVSLLAPGGAVWSSGLDDYNVIQDQALEPEAVDRRLPGKGEPYWLTANIDAAFYHEHGGEPIRVHATVAFTMLGQAQTTVVKRWGEPQAIAGDGICEFSKQETSVGAFCISPLRRPALTVVRFDPLPPGYPIGLVSLDPPSGGRDLGGFGIWRVVQSGMMTAPREPFAMSVEVREAVGHFERELDISAVRLKEFEEHE
jgi:hypothetical protein